MGEKHRRRDLVDKETLMLQEREDDQKIEVSERREKGPKIIWTTKGTVER